MKGKLLLVSLFFCSLFYLPAGITQIGIRGGVSIVDIGFKQYGQTAYLGYEINSLEHRLPSLAMQIGLFREFEISRRFAFQTELAFIQQGLDYSTSYLFDDLKYKLHIGYLNLPFLLKCRTAVRKSKQSGMYAGSYVAWKMYSSRVIVVEGIKTKSNISNVHKTDFGVLGGYTWDIGAHPARWSIDLRTSFSLINMMDRLGISWYYSPAEEYARNISISASVGYKFSNFWVGKSKK